MMMVSSTQTQLISEVAGEVMTIISHSYSCVCSIFHVVCTSRAGEGGCCLLWAVFFSFAGNQARIINQLPKCMVVD